MRDETYSSNYWTTREVTFADGSRVVETIAGPLNAGKRTKRVGAEFAGDNERTISAKTFAQAIQLGHFTREAR